MSRKSTHLDLINSTPSQRVSRMRRSLLHPVSALRERLRSISHGVELTRQGVDETREALVRQIAALGEEVAHTRTATELQQAEFARLTKILRALGDREPWQRERLHALRASDRYEWAFTQTEPLVSVVIPTYENHVLLRERAIPSVLAQTYPHFEVVVVGDAAPPEAAAAVESFGDARLRYSNLPYRGPYPDDHVARWHVAGVPPYNEAVRLACGRWIAPLDDDDAFRPEHLEHLLEAAQRERLELAYGKILQKQPGGGGGQLGRFPPELGQFNLQAALYHAGLAEIFQLELTDALFDDVPADWGLCRRMLRAGVRMGMVDEVTVEYYPSRVWAPRPAQSASSLPEWEFIPDGWDLAREDGHPCSRGWHVEEVAGAYRAQWPAFRAAVAAPRPLGVAHEVPPGEEMRNASLVAHNTALTLAYVLARAGRAGGPVSVLDWGGALGHQHEIASSALPEIEFDWHVRELPAVCREGRDASPFVTFHESDECLERTYDVVLASSSLQYVEDWRAHLRALTQATQGFLLLTRLPLVDSEPSFVVIQRAHAYGYATEYLGWVFKRSELLGAAATIGLELEREFFLQEPMEIVGAPADPTHGAFLFTRSSD